MVNNISSMALLFLLAGAAPVRAADTLADMHIAVDPALLAEGIDPGEYHPLAGEIYYAEATPQFVRNQIGPIVLIGDSIIAFLPAGLLPRGAINLAVSGNMTPQILASVAHIPLNASRVIVEGGINDLLNPNIPTNTVANYAAILAGIPKGAKVEVIGILPVNEAQLATNRDFAQFVDNTKIAALNAQIAPLCKGSCATLTVPALTTVDGIHPTPAGQAVLAKALH